MTDLNRLSEKAGVRVKFPHPYNERLGVRVKFPRPCRQRVLAGVKRKIAVVAGHRKERIGKSIP